MARFVSQHKGYRHGARNETPEHLGHDGKMVPYVRPLEAVFSHSLLLQSDTLVAKANLHFVGLPEDEAGRELDPNHRMSVFDSETARLQNGWTADEEQIVVEVLRNSSDNGRAFVEIKPDPVARPWPGYDEVDSPERIVEIALVIEADLDQVIAYELANRNATAVVNALREAQGNSVEEVVVSA